MRITVEKVSPPQFGPQLVALVAAHDAEIAKKSPGAPQTNLTQLIGLESQGLAAFFMAFDGDTPVGVMHFTLYELDDELLADNVDIYVRPDYRHSRAAHSMMAAGKRWCRDIGVVKIYTAVEAGMTDKFALHYGFRPVQTLFELDLKA